MAIGRFFAGIGFNSGSINASYQQIRTEVLAFWPEAAKASASGLVKAILSGSSNPSDASWDAITQAEIDLIRVLPTSSLILKYMGLRTELAELAGSELAVTYLAGLPVDASGLNDDGLRANCLYMLSQVQRLRALRKGFNRVRSYVTALATILLVLLIFLIIVWYRTATSNTQTSMFATTTLVFTGMLGGCVSALARLYSVSWINGIATGTDNLGDTFFSLLLNFILAILEGGLFAVILYTVFLGHIVSGSLFPVFQTITEANKGDFKLYHIYFEQGLASHADFAKALVWGFIAGFSERLVPDFIGTLGTSLKAPTQSSSKL